MAFEVFFPQAARKQEVHCSHWAAEHWTRLTVAEVGGELNSMGGKKLAWVLEVAL